MPNAPIMLKTRLRIALNQVSRFVSVKDNSFGLALMESKVGEAYWFDQSPLKQDPYHGLNPGASDFLK